MPTSVSALTEHDLASLSGNPPAPYAKFIFEEQQRILHTETELRKRHPDWNVLWSIFKASGNGMYTLYHKTAKESCLLHTLAAQSGLCDACRLLNDGSGIYVLVKNDMVDALLSGLQAGFLEKAGYSPDFSVCDTATSGFCPPPPKPRPQ